jgi:hypothetical protein
MKRSPEIKQSQKPIQLIDFLLFEPLCIVQKLIFFFNEAKVFVVN